ncbi:VCBS domain-containing protein [Microbulbifer sp. 2205BS26-8]|uniref:VCBS domain-containing protein n=1 Tax=Microbulbifer sp. 2205BS26-8 TaxID=3064386 RepID=UPI00273D9A26|nr:VCBS domain-containing protein [Microbulbifer sp. 2205BS26-8]MDP5208520.1 VCBS domain-containing protein [Microbulbifer sp. 2205BS26-8]
MNTALRLLVAISLSVTFTACGGGGGSTSGGDTDTETPGVISGGEGRVLENSETTTTGKLTDSTNANQTFEANNFQGTYGNLETSEDGSWTYTLEGELADPLNGGEQASEAFTVGVAGGSRTTKITISITGFDDPYTFQPESPLAMMVVDSKEFATGRLSLNDVDGNTPVFVSGTVAGSYGDFKLSESGDWEYTLNSKADSIRKGDLTEDSITFTLSDDTEQTVVFSIATLEPTESSIVFILMNFSDALATDRADISDIADMVFNDVDSLDNTYRENSLGQLKFLRHRVSDNTLQHYCYGEANREESSVDCIRFDIPDSQNSGILSIADAAARAKAGQQGEYTDSGHTWRNMAYQWAENNLVDENGAPLALNKWRHQVYIYPRAAYREGLIGYGVAAVGGRWSMVASDSDQLLMGHELGHNIGLGHAGWDSNNDGDTNDNGEDEYGTGGAFMGNRSESRLFGSAHREYMDWYRLFPEYTVTVEQASNSSQDLEIQAIELTAGDRSGTLPQQLKVESTGSSNGQSHYYVNYHVAHNELNPRPHYAHSVTVHYLNGRTSNHVAVLAQPGDDFTDEAIGLKIEYKSRIAENQSAVIAVSYSE